MGTRSGSPLGDMSGKIGTIVLTYYKTIPVVKGLPTKTKKVSPKQLNQREIFATVQTFLSKASGTIALGYQLPPKTANTEMNIATSYHLQNAVVGEYPDYYIDLSKVKLSKPIRSIEKGWNTEFTAGKNLFGEVSWEMNPFPDKATRWDDRAVIVIYSDTHKNFYRHEGVLRRDLSYSFTDRDREYFAGHEIFCWLFFISADGKFVSETEYLGMIKMPAV
jgi:hypothetical protein